jgi:photosystem II stability/assembly factor-like uncharacterized protein
MSLPRSLALTVVTVWCAFGCARPPTPTAAPPATPSPTASAEPTASPSPTLAPAVEPTLLAATPLPASSPLEHMAPGSPLVISWIQMVNTTTGWATGGAEDAADHVVRTLDGGVTWRDVTPPEETPSPDLPKTALVFALDSLRAWVIYAPATGYPAPVAPVVWRTTDGGESWQPSVPLSTEGLYEMFAPVRFFFLDASHGWLMVGLGAGMSHEYIALYRTMDGAVTWERLLDPYGIYIQSFTKTGMTFADSEYGWVTRDSFGVQPGFLLDITRDGGLTWEERVMDAPDPAPDFFDQWACGAHSPRFFTPTSGLFGLTCLSYQDFKTSRDFTYQTNDRGDTWTIVPSPGGDLQFLNTNEGWALGSSIYWTETGGRNWGKVKQVSWEGQFTFVDRQHGWAVARSEEAIAFVLTADGGASWREIDPVVGR